MVSKHKMCKLNEFITSPMKFGGVFFGINWFKVPGCTFCTVLIGWNFVYQWYKVFL